MVLPASSAAQQASFSVAATPNGPYWSRRHIEELFSQWHTTNLLPSAQLVVTELVAEAVRQTSPMTPEAQAQYLHDPASVSGSDLARMGTVYLRLSVEPSRLVVEVWDRSDQQPAAPSHDGVSLADICTRQGWYLCEPSGRVVWAEIAVPS